MRRYCLRTVPRHVAACIRSTRMPAGASTGQRRVHHVERLRPRPARPTLPSRFSDSSPAGPHLNLANLVRRPRRKWRRCLLHRRRTVAVIRKLAPCKVYALRMATMRGSSRREAIIGTGVPGRNDGEDWRTFRLRAARTGGGAVVRNRGVTGAAVSSVITMLGRCAPRWPTTAVRSSDRAPPRPIESLCYGLPQGPETVRRGLAAGTANNGYGERDPLLLL